MEIHFDQILLQLINFGIVLFVLVKFLYKPVLKILDQRSEKIDAGLAAAEKNLEEQAKVEELKKKQLTQAEKQASKIIEEAKLEAQHLSKDIVEKLTAITVSALQEVFAQEMGGPSRKKMVRTRSGLLNWCMKNGKNRISSTHVDMDCCKAALHNALYALQAAGWVITEEKKKHGVWPIQWTEDTVVFAEPNGPRD